MKESVYTRILYAIIRHVIGALAGVLVAHGWIDSELANQFTDSAALKIAIGILSFLGVLYLSYKDKIWEFVKTKVALALPPQSSMKEVVDIAKTVENKKEIATDPDAKV